MNQQRKNSIRKKVRTHLKDVKMFRELGFHYDGGRFVVAEEEIFPKGF